MEDEQIECTLALDSSPSVTDLEEKLKVTIPMCEVNKVPKRQLQKRKRG